MEAAGRRTCGWTALGRCDTPRTTPAAAASRAPPPRTATPAPRPPCAASRCPVNTNLPAAATRASPSWGCQWWPHQPYGRRRPPVSAAAVAPDAARSSPDPLIGAASGGFNGTSSRSDRNGCTSSASSGGQQGSTAPLRLVELPGRGRGVVATRTLSPGELLLVCRPLALLQGPSSAPPVQQQQQRQSEADATRNLKRRAPKAAAGAAGGAKASQMGAMAATSATTTAAAAVTAAAGCSEAALVAELQRMEWGPRQAQILTFLYRGFEESTQTNRSGPSASAPVYTAGGGSGLALDLADLTDPWDGRQAAADSGTLEAAAPAPLPAAVATAAGVAAAATRGSVLPADQLAAAVRLNATGLPSDDVLLAKLYDRPNLPFIGLWPAHAMFNHSCAPNAVAVVSGIHLLIRCCGPVPAGGEVLISYSGTLGLGPLQLRRALLERNHRFRCTCARCTAEEHVPRELAQLWNDIVMLASQQQPRLMAAAAALRGAGGSASSGISASSASSSGISGSASAAAADALPSLLDIRFQVAKCCGLFEETLGQLAPSPQEALWLQASMYPLYETRARCAQLVATAAAAAAVAAAAAAPAQQQQGQGQAQQGGLERAELERRLSEEYLDALSACVRLQGVANSGSDMHVQLAARYDAACAAHSGRHPGPAAQQLAAEARQRLERVLSCRYGTRPEAAAAGGRSAQVEVEGLTTPPALATLLAVLSKLQSSSQQQQQP